MRELLEKVLLRSPIAPLVLILAVVSFGLLFQRSLTLNHDVGWLLVAAELLLDGANIYGDQVIEVNPPMILYVFALPVAASRLLDLSIIEGFRLFCVLLALLSMLLCGRIFRVLLEEPRARLSLYFVSILAFSFLVEIDRQFGQREHLIFMLVVPYLLVAAARVRGLAVPNLDAVLAGVGGALAVSIKPHYIVAMGLLEVFIALRRRSLSSFLRVEMLVALGVGLTYLASIFILTPGYFSRVVPLAIDAYWAYFKPLSSLVAQGDLFRIGLGLVAALLVSRDERMRDLAWVLFIAAIGFYVAVLIQGTGWRYHWLPFRGTTTVLVSVLVLARVRWLIQGGAEGSGRIPSLVGIVGVAVACLWLLRLQPPAESVDRSRPKWRESRQHERVLLADLLDRHASGEYAYFLTPRMATVFPTVTESDARWGSRFSCLWLLPAVIRVQQNDPGVPAWLTGERARAVEQYLFDSVVEDLERFRPEIIFYDRRRNHQAYGRARIDVLAFFRRDPRFEAIWSTYTPQKQRVGHFSYALRMKAENPASE
jgi:hypothetical protein